MLIVADYLNEEKDAGYRLHSTGLLEISHGLKWRSFLVSIISASLYELEVSFLISYPRKWSLWVDDVRACPGDYPVRLTECIGRAEADRTWLVEVNLSGYHEAGVQFHFWGVDNAEFRWGQVNSG